MIRISVCGGRGKMGLRVCSLVKEDPELELSGIIEYQGHGDIGKDIDGVEVTSDIVQGIEKADVVIDFSSPGGALGLVSECAGKAKKIVIGTTGLSDSEVSTIENAAKKIPILLSPNMSVGVNLVFKIAGEINKSLPDYEKEIIETHHNRKKDSPSGTAAEIARILCSEKDKLVYGRKGNVGPRQKNEIGVHAVRGGNIIGEHTVMWMGPYERIELTHRAGTRDVFASGAIQAAKWLNSMEPGRLYSMSDVLK
jgi:4-hydroxy-tetrahydrodipicolinate reductase